MRRIVVKLQYAVKQNPFNTLSKCLTFRRVLLLFVTPTVNLFTPTHALIKFLTNNERNSWFASIPVDTGMELVRSELRALTSRVACLVSNVQINNEVWTVFIECMTFNDDLFSKWVFIKDSDSIVDQLGRYKAFSVRMDRYIEKISRAASSEWAIINLYSAGLTHSTISKITGVEEQTSKNAVSKMKRELNFPDRDYIILSSIYSLNYSKIIHNVISVLKLDC